MLTETPTYNEAPTIPNGKPVLPEPVPTPEPTLEPTPETPVPTPAPFVINVTSKPSSLIVATPSPVTADSKIATTCKNNAVITSITESGTVDITSQASHGTCAVLYDTSIIYYPIPGFIGSDKCEYSLCVSNDSTGELECSEGVLEVNVVDCPLVVSPTPEPTKAPTSSAPVSSEPTASPIVSPTKAPVSSAPVSPSPTESPVTDAPTESPTCDYAVSTKTCTSLFIVTVLHRHSLLTFNSYLFLSIYRPLMPTTTK